MSSSCNTDLIQVEVGPQGPAGPAGPVINMLTIEGLLTFSISNPFYSLVYNYPIVKGNVWKSTGAFSYSNDTAFMEITLTNFLILTTRKYTAILETEDQRRIGGVAVLPNVSMYYQFRLVEKTDDTLRFRLIRGYYGSMVIPNNQPALQGYESVKFAIHIVAED